MKDSDTDLIEMSANSVLSLLKNNKVSPLELLDALEKRINDIDSKVNSLPTLCFDRARSDANMLMNKPISERGLLAEMPIAI